MRSVLIALLLAGCVPKGKYTALQSELDATKTDLSTKLDAEAAKGASCADQFASEQKANADLQDRIAELEHQYATALSDKSKLDASVAEMDAALKDLESRRQAAEAQVAQYKDLLAKFKTLIDSGKLKVKIANGRMIVELASDILFDSGSAALSPAGESALADVAKVLAQIPGRSYQIEGHTDNVPIHSERFPSNWELGAARAITVVQTLQKGGVTPDRLSAASFSEYRPVAKNDKPENKAENRRIEIVLVPDLSQLPGYDELSKMASQ